jgi:NAD(P)-dependent dehydrogenase (short-subunit alcohol dehydrogenase family)
MGERVIVITGGFGILGRAVVAEAARNGALVAALDVAPTPPAELSERLGGRSMLLGNVDLSSSPEAEKALGTVNAKFGRVDALINIAGAFRWETVDAGDTTSWDLLYAMNVKTALNACKAAIPYLVKGGAGRIVNIGAYAALKAAAGMGGYTASKAGVHRLTEALAEELKDRGVTVNAVLPSIIDTPANRLAMPDAQFDRWVAPSQLATVILFLASDASKAITGALVPVTGRV